MAPVNCCGAVRNTPHCPMCGRKLQEAPLSELLNYCRKRRAAAQTSLNRSAAPAHTTEGIKRRNRLLNEVARLDRWINALQAVMQHANPPTTNASSDAPQRNVDL